MTEWQDKQGEIAVKIAEILATNEATVENLPHIFERVRGMLTVKCNVRKENRTEAGCRAVDDNHQWIVAKQIAPLLAESGVTVSGVYEIFGLVEQYLTVTRERTVPRRRGGYKFGMSSSGRKNGDNIPRQY